MPITLDSFRTIANSTAFSSRDIVVQGEGKTATAKLGNFIFSLGNTNSNGIIDGTFMKRYNARFGSEAKLSKHFTMGFNANYVQSDLNKQSGANDGITAGLYHAPANYDLAGIPNHVPVKHYVVTEEGNEYEGRTVIFATGVKHRMLGLPGEDALVGEGISFCAVCDGDFYSGKKVCVAGGGNSALQEAILLAEKCTEVVMLQDMDFFTGEERLQEVLFSKPNVKTYTGVKINKLLTEGSEEEPTLVGVEIEHVSAAGEVNGAAVGDAGVGTTETITCDGLFVAIGLIPENDAFKEFENLNDYGYFDTDEHCVTKTPGIFVAGDCRSKFVRQVTTAAADGAVAALAACRYVNGL